MVLLSFVGEDRLRSVLSSKCGRASEGGPSLYAVQEIVDYSSLKQVGLFPQLNRVCLCWNKISRRGFNNER
jgi:hypothetical protein